MSNFALGCRAFCDCLQKGDDIAAHMNGLLAAPRSQANIELLSGAVSMMVECYFFLHDSYADQTRAQTTALIVQKFNPVDKPWIERHVSAMLTDVFQNRSKFGFSAKTPPAPAPMQVQVVSMPTRVTESAVTYDKSGNIASTSQVERDEA